MRETRSEKNAKSDIHLGGTPITTVKQCSVSLFLLSTSKHADRLQLTSCFVRFSLDIQNTYSKSPLLLITLVLSASERPSSCGNFMAEGDWFRAVGKYSFQTAFHVLSCKNDRPFSSSLTPASKASRGEKLEDNTNLHQRDFEAMKRYNSTQLVAIMSRSRKKT